MKTYTTTTTIITDNETGETFHVHDEEGFQSHLQAIQSPFYQHAVTGERICRFASLIPGATYNTKQESAPIIPMFDQKACLINQLIQGAHYTWRSSQYTNAVKAFQVILGHQKELFGNDFHPDILQTMVDIGALQALAGDVEGAIDSYKQASALGTKLFGYGHVKITEIWTALGHLQLHLGRTSDAIASYGCSLAQMDSLHGRDSIEYANACCHSGLANYQHGWYQLAIRLYESALDIMKTHHGKCHPKVAVLHNNIAFCQDRLGLYQEAQKHAHEVLVILQTLGDMEPTNTTSTSGTGEMAQV